MTENIVATDTNGRKYTLRPLGPEHVFDLLEACGEQSTNRGLMAFIGAAFSVTAIDDLPVPAPRTLPQIRALIAKIGAEGMSAVRASLEIKDEPAAEAEVAKN